MPSRNPSRFAPGTSVLGGAAAGLSYEGCLRDALACEEWERRREAGRSRHAPPAPKPQASRPEPAPEWRRAAALEAAH